ncbi:hypothetical protein PS15m_006999 [Mucor circinelloides]
MEGFECRLLATGKEYQRYIDCQRLGKSTCLVVCMIPLARDLLQTTEEIKAIMNDLSMRDSDKGIWPANRRPNNAFLYSPELDPVETQ